MALTLSALIPTKNRPDDLVKAVDSVLAQTRPPQELIVVDQSLNDQSSRRVHHLFSTRTATRLVYIHDPSVTGLVDAKRVGSARATCEVVCFLEDDVVLEPEYMAHIERGFEQRLDMWGCSGIITNHPRVAPMFVVAHTLFFRGIFKDPRARLTLRARAAGERLIPCDILSGGVSCWRREVFRRVPFDTTNDFFMFEDMEFSTRVVKTLGHHLYINPRARLEHLGSTVNRDRQGARQRRKMIEAVTFYKTRRKWPGARSGLLMGAVWWFGEAALQAVRLRSVGPVAGYFRGVVDGMRKPICSSPASVASFDREDQSHAADSAHDATSRR